MQQTHAPASPAAVSCADAQVVAYQQAVAAMWQCYGNMLRLVLRDHPDAERLATGVVVHDSIRNLLICVGGALSTTLGRVVETARLDDDVARLQISAFMVTRRADELFDESVVEEAAKVRLMNADLSQSQSDGACARIAAVHLEAAAVLLAAFKADFPANH